MANRHLPFADMCVTCEIEFPTFRKAKHRQYSAVQRRFRALNVEVESWGSGIFLRNVGHPLGCLPKISRLEEISVGFRQRSCQTSPKLTVLRFAAIVQLDAGKLPETETVFCAKSRLWRKSEPCHCRSMNFAWNLARNRLPWGGLLGGKCAPCGLYIQTGLLRPMGSSASKRTDPHLPFAI